MTRSSHKLAGSYLLLVVAEVVAKGVTFAAFGYMGRVLGPHGQGYVEFAVAVTLCASLVIDLGFNPYGARQIARDPHRTSDLVGEIVLARIGLSLLAAAVVGALALLPGTAPQKASLLGVYALSLLPTPLLLQWVFQGHDRMIWVAVATIVRQAVFAAVIFATVRGIGQILWVGIAELVAVSAAAVFCLVIYRRRFSGRIPLGRGLSPTLFREGVPIGLGQMFWATRMFAGTILLGYIATADEVGRFGAAHRILIAAHTFVWWYFFNMLPALTRHWHVDRDGFQSLMRHSLALVLWCGLLFGAVGVLVSRPIMTLTYGAAFAPGAPVLRYFAAVCLVLAISGHYRFGLIAAGYQKQEMMTAAMGAVLAVGLIYAGYVRWGITGAAMGLLAAEVTVWAATWWWARTLLGAVGHGVYYLRPVAAILVSLALMWLISPRSVWVQAAIVSVVMGCAVLSDGALRWRRRGLRVSETAGGVATGAADNGP